MNYIRDMVVGVAYGMPFNVKIYDPESNRYDETQLNYKIGRENKSSHNVENRFTNLRYSPHGNGGVVLTSQCGLDIFCRIDGDREVTVSNIIPLLMSPHRSPEREYAFNVRGRLVALDEPHINVIPITHFNDWPDEPVSYDAIFVVNKQSFNVVVTIGYNLSFLHFKDKSLHDYIVQNGGLQIMIRPTVGEYGLTNYERYRNEANLYRECFHKKHKFHVEEMKFAGRTWMYHSTKFLKVGDYYGMPITSLAGTYLISNSNHSPMVNIKQSNMADELVARINRNTNNRYPPNHIGYVEHNMSSVFPERKDYISELYKLCKPRSGVNVHNEKKVVKL